MLFALNTLRDADASRRIGAIRSEDTAYHYVPYTDFVLKYGFLTPERPRETACRHWKFVKSRWTQSILFCITDRRGWTSAAWEYIDMNRITCCSELSGYRTSYIQHFVSGPVTWFPPRPQQLYFFLSLFINRMHDSKSKHYKFIETN